MSKLQELIDKCQQRIFGDRKWHRFLISYNYPVGKGAYAYLSSNTRKVREKDIKDNINHIVKCNPNLNKELLIPITVSYLGYMTDKEFEE